jgi:hypothetical protein
MTDTSNSLSRQMQSKHEDDVLTNETHSVSAANVDIDMVNKSLARVNPFQASKRKSVFLEKQHATVNQTLLILQMSSVKTSDDDSVYLNLTLRELLNLVLLTANNHDEILLSKHAVEGDDAVENKTPTFDSDAKKSTLNKRTSATSALVPSTVRPISIATGNRGGNMSRSPSFTEGRYGAGDRILSGDRGPTHFLSNPHTSHLPQPVAMVDETGRDIGFNAVNILRLRDLRRLDFSFNPVDEANVIVR